MKLYHITLTQDQMNAVLDACIEHYQYLKAATDPTLIAQAEVLDHVSDLLMVEMGLDT